MARLLQILQGTSKSSDLAAWTAVISASVVALVVWDLPTPTPMRCPERGQRQALIISGTATAGPKCLSRTGHHPHILSGGDSPWNAGRESNNKLDSKKAAARMDNLVQRNALSSIQAST